ncbi:unnamed protein product [Urochloa decumbens]|uniref:F-box domain-containing protein n=1 Tax=Urochloa decumbens TaxID=240449 RepID=A0ABC9B4W3_9POAL
MPQSMTAAEAQADGADRISALPDGILRHVLGFLEADEAVRTSVLAQRWEDLWKFMRTLRITRSSTTISSSRKFVDHLLNLRGRSSLDKFLFSLTYANDVSPSENQVSCLNRWTRYALMQEVEELSLDVREEVYSQTDLRFCPSFSKLKTLLLNEWCVTGDHCALACILQHSPVLEKLTIDLCREHLHVGLLFLLDEIKDQIVPSKAIYNSIEQSFTSEQLNLVEVNQCVFDIMKFLITYGIPLHKISIRQNSRSSGCLN